MFGRTASETYVRADSEWPGCKGRQRVTRMRGRVPSEADQHKPRDKVRFFLSASATFGSPD
jgi:hypothetical protein